MAHPFGSIETEVAPMLVLVWRHLAPTVANLIRINPELARRLSLAPPRSIHVLAAFIERKLEQGAPPIEIGDEIARCDLREILAVAIDGPHELLLGAMGRLGPTAANHLFYTRLNAALSLSSKHLLLETEVITDAVLHVAEQVSGDTVLLAASKAIGTSESALRSLMLALEYLRDTGLASDIEALPLDSRWKAICRRIKNDLGRGIGLKAPFDLPHQYRLINRMDELLAIGRTIGNCVSSLRSGGDDHFRDFLAKKTLFVTKSEPDDRPLLATLNRLGPKTWAFGEIAQTGPLDTVSAERNTMIKDFTNVAAQTGHKIYSSCPIAAITSLAWRTREPDEEADDGANEDNH